MSSLNGKDFKEYTTIEIEELNDWYTIDTFRDNHPLTTFSLKFIIHKVIQGDGNTRIRQVRWNDQSTHFISRFGLYPLK